MRVDPMTPPTEAPREADAFHAHLDECAQCRNHPFALCPRGAVLLQAAGNAIAKEQGHV